MKKTMFITSVIMVVVMAIALTTSSLAWFSASDGGSVGTNSVTISAKSNTSSGLKIARSDMLFYNGSIDLDAGATGSYIPVVPYGASAAGTAANVLYALQHNRFVGNSQKTEVVGGVNTALFADKYFQGYMDGSNAAYYKVEDLFVANSGSEDTKVKASISITNEDENGAILYVAVLARHESATYAKINGDVNNDGVLTGYIDANGNATQDAGEVVYAGKYVVVTPADPEVPESEDVYGWVLYIDKDGDKQITSADEFIGQTRALKTVAAYLEENELTDAAIVGEQFGTEEEEDFADRDYAEANNLKWELLAFTSSAYDDAVRGKTAEEIAALDLSKTVILGRYNGDGTYKTNTAGTKYVLSDGSEVAIVVQGENDDTSLDDYTPESDEAFATRKADQIAELSDPTRGGTLVDQPVLVPVLEDEGQNQYFKTNAVVADAYDEDGVVPSINAKTEFVLRGLKNGEELGDYMQVKVLAWYANDLANDNSGAYHVEENPFGTSKSFTITFETASVE